MCDVPCYSDIATYLYGRDIYISDVVNSLQRYFEQLRLDFPIFSDVEGGRLIYLDSAATSQKPRQVLEAVNSFYRRYNANVHRGVYGISVKATEEYENARKRVASFINARPDEIVFVRGATEGLNLIAYSWALRNISADEEVLLTEMEHHSNIVPWQLVARLAGFKISYIPFTSEGYLDMAELDRFRGRPIKLLSFTYASNVLGTINDVKALTRFAHEIGALAVVDAAQAAPHMRIDVKELDCDFLVFSGHKMLGPTGIGVLYGRRSLLEAMEPFMGGGEMIKEVRLEAAEWNDVPWKFEAGTPNIAGSIGLAAAVDYLEKVGMDNVRRHEEELTKLAIELLSEIPFLTIYGPRDYRDRCGLVSFYLADIHPHDLASFLDRDGICVRAGHHCAMPIHTRLGIPASTRASFYLYNTPSEIEVLAASLRRALKTFKVIP
ncbi:Cysteine desulfurase SufS [archaeon HR01]|nr:Cysteine desulfurase SufS [archaeon HR01]